ncbi:zinc finger and BTB domain-containing protein 7B isoform X2 [Boleophthalmus pectinirostris]|nr:zinc finger and BTB domain-containing protein 7B isoform X2 [Boleophthalmus pectinirostris]
MTSGDAREAQRTVSFSLWTEVLHSRPPHVCLDQLSAVPLLVAMSPGEDGLIGIPFPEHSNELLSHLNNQRRTGLLCDLTLTSHGARYPTHRSVMAAVSVYFRHLFGTEAGGGEGGGFTVCQLDCVAPDALDALLEFAYTATLTIPSSGMRDVLRGAQLLGIQCVADACRDILGETEETEMPPEEYKVQQTTPKKTLQSEYVEKVSRRKTDKNKVKKIGSNHTSIFTPPSPVSHPSPASDSLRSLPSTQPPSPEKEEFHQKFGLNGDHRPVQEHEPAMNGGLAHWFQDRSHSRPSSVPRSIDKLSEEDDIEGLVEDGVLTKNTPVPLSVSQREAMAAAAVAGVVRKRKSQTPQQCPVCNKIIHGAGKLPRHMRTHTGEKPFQCTACGVRFTRNDKLKIHMRKHTGERPYPCPHCSARFLHSYDLKNHLSLHSGARPFECPLCHKAFAREDHLQRHRKGHSCLEVRTRRPRRGPDPVDDPNQDGKESISVQSMQGHSSGFLALRESVKSENSSAAGPPSLQMFHEDSERERERTMALQALAQLAPLRLATHPALFLRSLELHSRQAEESGRAHAIASHRGVWGDHLDEDVADEDAEEE